MNYGCESCLHLNEPACKEPCISCVAGSNHNGRASNWAPRTEDDLPCVAREMADEPILDAASTPLPDSNPKTRVGITKPTMRGIPSAALLHLGGAMADGVQKYGIFNWREHAVAASVYEDAIWRHLVAWRDGENTAADSGQHHLAHVMACCAIILDAMENGKLLDDRGPAGVASEMIARHVKNHR